jgi:tetratricopeptide (TPR) repeat protein
MSIDEIIAEISRHVGDDAEFLQEFGKTCLYCDYEELAKAVLDKSLELNSLDPFTLLYLGNYHFGRDEFDAALERFQDALAIDEHIAYVYSCVADAYEKLGKNKKALKHHKKAKKVDPVCKSSRRSYRRFKKRQGIK